MVLDGDGRRKMRSKRIARPQPGHGSTGRYRADEWQRAPYFVVLERRASVDLNYLFHRQQIERARSETAESVEARTAHEQLARHYEDRIEALTSDDYHFRR